jgi:hypothetical protein
VGWRGRGVYGTVYRVECLEGGAEGPFVLKMAHHAMDARFDREQELLSRIHHPNVPRLRGQGVWQHPGGAFPYLVMECLDGLTLYEWAVRYTVTSRQALRVLAQAARALEATHAIPGVHRDVKGDNLLVRPEDGHVFLIDFGAGDYRGAVTLTAPPLAPGTPNYRSPEAWAYQRVFYNHPSAHYEGTACDDLFALGIAAHRLVTGKYPPPTEPGRPGAEVWQPGGPGPRPPRALNPRVCLELESLIMRLVAVDPSERFQGRARRAAEALEKAAESAGPEADVLLFDEAAAVRDAWKTEQGVVARDVEPRSLPPQQLPPEQGSAETVRKPAPPQSASLAWVGGAAVAALGLSLVSMAVWLPMRQELARLTEERASREGDSVGLGDSAETRPVSTLAPNSTTRVKPGVGLPMPEGPFPNQRKPPCDRYGEEEVRGGCWYALRDAKAPCKQDAYDWKSACYLPSFPVQRQPTSTPP